MHTLVFDRHNIDLEYENNCLIIRQPDSISRSIPFTHIRKIICLHSTKLSTSLLGQLWERGIDFVVLNSRYSERSFALYPQQQKQVERRCVQYAWQQNEAACLHLAKALCQHRIICNQRILAATASPALRLALITSYQNIANCVSLTELRGIEGSIQRQIFSHWREQLPPELGFTKRQRRPPPDPVNGLLSLTYTLVMQEAIRQCTAAGLDSQLGFYHRIAFGRHSLACDVMEPVRPFCEQWVVRCFTEKTLDRRHFVGLNSPGKPCFLGKRGREIYYQAIAPQLVVWQRQLKATAHWLNLHINQLTFKEHHE